MLLTKAEASGWVVALMGVAVMALVVFHGPFNHVNKAHASAFAPMQVKIISDARDGGKYSPSSFTLHVGQAVTFTNVSNAQHTVTQLHDLFNSTNLNNGGARWTWVASKTGVYPYYCAYHPRMLGTISVIQ